MAAEAVWEVILIIEDRLKNKYDDPTFQQGKLLRHMGLVLEDYTGECQEITRSGIVKG